MTKAEVKKIVNPEKAITQAEILNSVAIGNGDIFSCSQPINLRRRDLANKNPKKLVKRKPNAAV